MGSHFDPALVRGKERINHSRDEKTRPDWDPAVRRRALVLERAALERFGYPVD